MRLWRWFYLILILVAIVLLGRCGHRGGPATGIVYEVVNPDSPPPGWKYIPSENAEILVIWNGFNEGEKSNWHGGSHCIKGIYISTTKDGTFTVPGWGKSIFFQTIDPLTYPYKQGFTDITNYGRPNAAALPPEVFSKPDSDRRSVAVRNFHILKPDANAPPREQSLMKGKDCPTN
jgi:hypothetical protein